MPAYLATGPLRAALFIPGADCYKGCAFLSRPAVAPPEHPSGSHGMGPYGQGLSSKMQESACRELQDLSSRPE
jgi:hypothetical protein